MKKGKRLIAMALALTVALGSVCWEPPKAKALFTEPAAALGCALLVSVIVGTTADLIFTDAVKEDIGYAIDGLVTDFIEATGETVVSNADDFFYAMSSGAAMLETGAIQLAETAGGLAARFINWLREDKGLVGGGGPLNFGTIDTDFALYNGFKYPNIENHVDSSVYPYTFIFHRGSNVFLYYTSEPVYLVSYTLYLNPGLWGWSMYNTVKNSWVVQSLDGNVSSASPLLDISSTNYFLWSSYDVLCSESVYFEGSLPVPIYSDDAQLQPKSEFQPIPNEIPAGQTLTVNTGLVDLSFTDEQAAADSIFSAALAGTLSPTVAVEGTATDIPGTDTETGTDTDASILSWVKKIWQTVSDIPGAIADAVAGIFVPSADFYPTAISNLKDAFSDRMGLLTYPISVLFDFLDRVVNLSDQQPILTWGNIYLPGYATPLVAAGQYNLNDAIGTSQGKQLHDIYLVIVDAMMILAFVELCRHKYQKIIHN